MGAVHRQHGLAQHGLARAVPRSLGDALGVALTVIVVLAVRIGGTTVLPRQIVLIAAAAALIPVIIVRLRAGRAPGVPRRILLGIAWAFVVWTGISTVAHGALGSAPWITSIYGWSGRGIGLLTIAAAALLLTAAALLTYNEITRLLAWLVVAASINAAVIVVQAAGAFGGSATGDGYTGTLGNSNFAAAFSGLVLPVAVTLAIAAAHRRSTRTTALYSAATVLLAVAAAVAGPLQGPLTAAIGVLVAALACAAAGPVWSRWVAGGVTAVGVAIVALSAFGLGPMARLWEVRTMRIRMVYWETALADMRAHPLFGSGPDGFARVVGEFRPEEYLAFRPPEHHVSAAHDVPLQFGATIGVPGLVLWFALMVGAAVAVAIALRRGVNTWVMCGVSGALAAYIAQALISVDMIALLTCGWVLVGVAAAASAPESQTGRLRTRGWATSGVCAAVGVAIMLPPTLNAQAASSITTVAEAQSVLLSPWTPCTQRAAVAAAYAAQPGLAVGPLREAWEADRRCPGVGEALADAALRTGDPATADLAAGYIVAIDPLNTPAWIDLGLARAQLGDLSGAIAARAEARRTKNLTQLGRYREQMRELTKAIRALRKADRQTT